MKGEMNMTIREIESKKLENIKKTKKQMSEWGLYRYPTPLKKIPSISILRKKLDEFFDSHNTQYSNASDLPTVTELALFLGYPSQRALYNEINNPNQTEPEYAMYLERAVSLITDRITRKQMEIAEVGKRWEGIGAVLDREDRISEKTMPDTDSKSAINIQINLNAREKAKNALNENLSSFLSELKMSNLKQIDADVKSIEDRTKAEEDEEEVIEI